MRKPPPRIVKIVIPRSPRVLGRPLSRNDAGPPKTSAWEWLKVLKKRGISGALLAIALSIGLAVVDIFTAQIGPKLYTELAEFLSPSVVILSLDEPVNLADKGIKLRADNDFSDADRVPEYHAINNKEVSIRAHPSGYVLTIIRKTAAGGYQTTNTSLSFEKRSSAIPKKIGDLVWLETDETGIPVDKTLNVTRETRWSATTEDYRILVEIDDPIRHKLLSTALAEIGTDENGSEHDKQRITEYWTAAGFGTPDKDIWGFWPGAFVSWVVSRSGLEPIQPGASSRSWLQWGKAVSRSDAKPGMIAVFKRSASTGMVGIVLRVEPNCVEIVGGNIANRVAISCIGQELLGIRSPETVPISQPDSAAK